MSGLKIISIIVPVFNEKNTLESIIKKVEKADVLGLEKEIIIVDDGSNDGTSEIAKKYENKYKVFFNKRNKGKGNAVIQGMKNAAGDIIIIQDSDSEYNPDEYAKLLKPILEGEADVVYGSRFIGSEPHRILYFWHYVGNKLLTLFSDMFSNLNLTDMETGYKVFKKEIIDLVLPKMKSSDFGFEPEITARIAKLSKLGKCRIYEVGISYSGRTYQEGKKINWKDGMKAIWYVIKYNIFS